MTNEMLRSDDAKPVRLLVALELSLSKWGLSAAVEGQPRKRVKTVAVGDYPALLEAVTEFKVRFKLPLEAPVVFCYEAGRDGFYPYRRLTALGHDVWVIDSASIEVSRHRRNAKSDGIDAEAHPGSPTAVFIEGAGPTGCKSRDQHAGSCAGTRLSTDRR